MLPQTSRATETYAAFPVAAPASPRELACQLAVLAESCNVHAYRSVGLALRNLRFKLGVALAAVEEPIPIMKGAKAASPAEWVGRAYKQFDLRSDYTTVPLKAMSQVLRGQFTTYAIWLLLKDGPEKVSVLAQCTGIERHAIDMQVHRCSQHFSRPAKGTIARGKQPPPIPCLPPQFIAMLLPWSNLRSTPSFLTTMVTGWLANPDVVDCLSPYIVTKSGSICTNPAYCFMTRRKRKQVVRDEGEWPERTWINYGTDSADWRLEDVPF